MKAKNIEFYLNEKKINFELFQCIQIDEYNRKDESFFVNLNQISSLLNFKVKYYNNRIKLYNGNFNIAPAWINYYNGKIIRIIIDIKNDKKDIIYVFGKNNILLNKSDWLFKAIKVINKNNYIGLGVIRFLINGSFKKECNKIILFTYDYERLDIPKTLLECYDYFDKNLEKDLIDEIKNNKDINLHFTLGLWIRNNWIYPGHNRIKKIFKNSSFHHVDSQSKVILDGYHYYLNGKYKTIDELDVFKNIDKETYEKLSIIIHNFEKKIITFEDFENQMNEINKEIYKYLDG